MEAFAYLLMILSMIIIALFTALYFFNQYKHIKMLNAVFNYNDDELITKDQNSKKEAFALKLTRAGLTMKQFQEIFAVSILAGFALISLVFILDMSSAANTFFIFLGVVVGLFTPYLYLEEQIKARIKRIESDLAVFIDLLIIILEGGGGLNNAIDRVTQEGESVIGKDLLEESKKFKNEYITYSSDIAFKNLVQRTGSEAIATIVGFMRLSEETGIGVKTIFENQAQEIKDMEMLNVEKRAATMNIGITFVMFIFILPAVIAMIAFPMAADALMPGF